MVSHQGIQSQHAFQAALNLGLRQKEWLFMSCHNYWIVFRLVRGGSKPPFLAFSPLITMEDSSVPFRTLLGAILSVVKGGVVDASVFDDNQILNTTNKKEEKGSESTFDADGGSREYKGCSGQEPAGPGPFTHKHAQDGSNKAALMVWPFCAPFPLNGPSEIHLDRCHHLPHCLLNHLKFGSVFILSQTTSLIFHQFPTMANNVCGWPTS